MQEYELKNGCNPNQQPARIFMMEEELPIKMLNGIQPQHPSSMILLQVQQ